MSTIDELRAQRFAFLQAVYDETGGDTTQAVRLYGIGEKLGFADDRSRRIVEYLNGEQLVDWLAQGFIRLSHPGLKEMEQALRRGRRPVGRDHEACRCIAVARSISLVCSDNSRRGAP